MAPFLSLQAVSPWFIMLADILFLYYFSSFPYLCGTILHLNNFHRGWAMLKHVCQTDVRICPGCICIHSWRASCNNTPIRVGRTQLLKWTQANSTIHWNKKSDSETGMGLLLVFVSFQSYRLVHYIKKNTLNPHCVRYFSRLLNVHVPLLCWLNFDFIGGITVSG